MFRPLTCHEKHALHAFAAKSGEKVSGILLPTGKKLACLDLGTYNKQRTKHTVMVILDVEHLNRQYGIHKGCHGSNLFWLKNHLFVCLLHFPYVSLLMLFIATRAGEQ